MINGKEINVKKQPPTQKFLRHIETQAMRLRKKIGLGSDDVLDPHLLAPKLKLSFVRLEEIESLTDEDIEFMNSLDAKAFSGGGKPLPNGHTLILLNPNQTRERENVTIMEEVAHVHYGHEMTLLPIGIPGLEARDYNDADEQEAYWTAGATLLPSRIVAQAVWRNEKQAAQILSDKFGASIELAEMRIKTLKLWPHYKV